MLAALLVVAHDAQLERHGRKHLQLLARDAAAIGIKHMVLDYLLHGRPRVTASGRRRRCGQAPRRPLDSLWPGLEDANGRVDAGPATRVAWWTGFDFGLKRKKKEPK